MKRDYLQYESRLFDEIADLMFLEEIYEYDMIFVYYYYILFKIVLPHFDIIIRFKYDQIRSYRQTMGVCRPAT